MKYPNPSTKNNTTETDIKLQQNSKNIALLFITGCFIKIAVVK